MKLNVVFADTHRNRIAIIHENNTFPYSFRSVEIEFTEEQINKLKPQKVGEERGKDVFEELYNSWIEGSPHP